jgi:NAD(P)-dependent dehydrogenase (short-subunit alcohol dehydrogenase family)
VKRRFAAIFENYGRIDNLVYSAGIFPKIPFLSISVEEWDKIHAINLRGSFLVVREAIRMMREQGRGGAIVNISSVSGERPMAFRNIAYNTSKAGVTNLTRTAALEFGPGNIRINAVLPGGTATEGAQEAVEKMQADGLQVAGPVMVKTACRWEKNGIAGRYCGRLFVFRQPGFSKSHRTIIGCRWRLYGKLTWSILPVENIFALADPTGHCNSRSRDYRGRSTQFC